MYLSKIRIKNFRSVKDAEIRLIDGKNVIVGNNSVGKSNIFAAIDIVLGENNPTYSRNNISEEDFYYAHNKETGEFERSNEIFILCELSKNDEELIDCRSFDVKSCLLPVYGETVTLGREKKKEFKKIKLIDYNRIPDIFEISETNFNKCWLSPNEDKYSEIINNASKIIYIFRAYIDENGEIIKDMRMLVSSDAENSWYLCFRASIRKELILSAVLPSFRDPNTQLKINQYSWFGKLVRHIAVNSAEMERLQEAYVEANDIANSMFDDFRRGFQEEIIDRIFPNSRIQFQLNADSRNEIYKTLKIYVDDGFKSEITSKGSGFQSAFIINMFKKYADIKSTSSTAILCLEEPELFLHPHARRALSKQIDNFCESGHQAILTTHSVDFLSDIDFGMNIITCNKKDNGTKTKEVSLRDYKNLFVYDYQSEIFFADLVIICEGLDSYLIKQVAEYYYGEFLDAKNISVVSVQGKDQIPEFARLLYSIGIKCCIFCDFDFLLRDRAEERRKYDASAHKSLESLPEGFFRQFIEMSAGDKVLSRIRKFRAHVKRNSEQQFYTAKKLAQLIAAGIVQDEHYQGLKNDMRSVGIFILDGEIEDIFLNSEILGQGAKFTNEKLFQLHSELKKGRSIVEFIDPTQIHEAVKKVSVDFT